MWVVLGILCDWLVGRANVCEEKNINFTLGTELGGLFDEIWQQWMQRWTDEQRFRIHQTEQWHRYRR